MGHLGRDTGVVVDECYDARVERSLGSVVDTVHIFCISFVLFTNTPAGSAGRGYPGQAQGSSGEVSICENVGETEVGVVSFTVKIEEV